jgi:hypothetical protein
VQHFVTRFFFYGEENSFGMAYNFPCWPNYHHSEADSKHILNCVKTTEITNN